MTITHVSPETAESGRRIPLSFNQEFLRGFDKGETDGAFGHRHTLVCGWRVTGALDTDALADALNDIVERHEVLRTSIHGDESGSHQTVHPATPAELRVVDLADDGRPRDERAEAFLNELDATPFSVAVLPHLRAEFGRFDATDGVLVLVTHHTATDAWSVQLLMRDLAAAYTDRAAGRAPSAEPAHQYQEFARWQQDSATGRRAEGERAYWSERLAGAEITGITTDRPREDVAAAYGVHRFVFDAELSTSVTQYARATRSTPFMVLAAAYSLLLRGLTGTTDVVFPTFSSGRYEERFAESVGPFFNFVPIRIDTTGSATFGAVLEQARAACLGAYQHEIPFAHIAQDSPGLLAPFADGFLAVVAFEVLQSPFAAEDGAADGPRFTEIRRRVLSQSVSSAIPDGGLWAMDVLPDGNLAGSLKFDNNRFDEATAVALVERFRALLHTLATAPDTAVDAG
ncbi:condensation domain-containing protein [Streptomyces sp. NBC_01433]|uniref:condensation domain-containing protein n=1 Tax=Streptomyces sp. NBC_01433 TaxID=2903864 RepID=UPI002253069C|nr:condensation domain-containing protein [Streptomyces sp. NBC_01433]MCX4681820.1 condensation domain-containing protein [Streptomyces sp. NBC_01433]